jgi:hypothetical protein
MQEHTKEAIRQAVLTHPFDQWRNWFETRSPALIRVWSIKPTFGMIAANGNIGGGHLSSQRWHDELIGVPIVNPSTEILIREMIGVRAYTRGYIYLTKIQALIHFMAACPTQMEWIMEQIAAGETEFFIPVEFFVHSDNKVRARLRTDTDPP